MTLCSAPVQGELKTFLTRYAPGTLPQFGLTAEECVAADSPALVDINAMFGNRNAGSTFLMCYINDINEYAGTDKKMDVQQRIECASTLYELLFHLKVTEVMLFFQRFKSGRYGKFFGAVDAMTLGTAAHVFLKERKNLIERIERQRADREREADRRDREINAITRQEFDLWQRLMTTGDPYAFEVSTGDEVRRYLRYFFNSKRNENEHRTD